MTEANANFVTSEKKPDRRNVITRPMGINSHLNKTQPWEGSIEIHVLITIPFPLLLYGRYESWTKRCLVN